jgi:putative drug exporter of the RND superfamily
MAPHLYRLGRWSFRNRRKVLAGWLIALVAVMASAAAFSGQENNSFVVPGTESQDAQDLLDKKFPGTSGATARIVFAAPEGEKLTDPENQQAVRASLANAKSSADVSQVSDMYKAGTLSKDQRIGFADVIYPMPAGEIDDHARDQLGETGKPAEEAGLTVEYGGGLVTDTQEANSEGIGMMVAFLVLGITLASLLAAGMPLLTAVIGVLIGVTGLHALSGLIDVSETAPILATMLGLAVGIDYALFILSRYREDLGKGME